MKCHDKTHRCACAHREDCFNTLNERMKQIEHLLKIADDLLGYETEPKVIQKALRDSLHTLNHQRF